MPRGGILVVEDNQVNLMILRAMLRKLGHEPHVATDGAEGVRMAEEVFPELVLMDLNLPKLDGIAAATEIVHRLAGDAPAIIAVTANASAVIRMACLSAGFGDFLNKPIRLNELTDIVSRYVAGSRQEPR
jgi:CheY-like chemotaxis protein